VENVRAWVDSWRRMGDMPDRHASGFRERNICELPLYTPCCLNDVVQPEDEYREAFRRRRAR
jgi:hypothetical protein